MEALIIIPARMGSSRFPGKPLAKINGKEMILHVCEKASQAFPVIVATPDQEIWEVVTDAGFSAMMTGDHMTGTDRIAEVAERIDAEIYINVQGDEPLTDPEDILTIYRAKKEGYNIVISGIKTLQACDNDYNVVKVVNGALTREGESDYAQCGIYAFNAEELEAFSQYPDKEESLKKYDNIELMRFVDMGYKIGMVLINGGIAVDMPRDIQRVEEEMEHGRE